MESATRLSYTGSTPLDRALGIWAVSVEEFSIRGEMIGFNMQFTSHGNRKHVTMQMFTYDSRPVSFRVEEVRTFMRMVYTALYARFSELPAEQDFHEIAEGLELEQK